MVEDVKAPYAQIPDKITLENFAELVRQMRHNQKRYFQFRKPEILETCKMYERTVDRVIEKMNEKQMKLF